MAREKSRVEVLLMPLAVALVGTAGTYFITSQQTESAQLASTAAIESADRRAQTDQQIKVLEIFSEYITSDNPRQREIAVRILRAVDASLAEKLATAVAETETEDSVVRMVAREVAAEEAARGYSFPVVGSFDRLADAIRFANRLATGRKVPHSPEIYLAENRKYGVTLGGYLSYLEV